MKPSILPSTPSVAAGPPRGWPVLRLGFRPFYIGAAAFGCVAVPAWLAMFLGRLPAELQLAPLLWHAHEMLFGFAAAVIVGFLLTAGKAWTGLATPRGAFLGALAALWLAARIAAVVGPTVPYALYAVLDLALLPVVAVVLADVLLRAHNRRGLALAGLMLLLSLANLCFHLAVLGFVDVAPMAALHAALALIVMIECVMTGRVLPAFTANVTPGLRLQLRPRAEQATLAMTAIALLAWVFAAPAAVKAGAFGLAAVGHLHRQWTWQPWVARGRPILWVLHAAYLWLPVGFVLLALAALGWVAPSAGVHALAVGATGGLIIGMLTRTARGHTGRPLVSSRLEVLAYGLVFAAAVLRVLLPLVAPQWLVLSLVGAALAWSAAFAIYFVVYTPWLMTTRLDGKDG
ncbi:MAG: NnrS family protein [Pseudomonadota bacterium]|nr:NnrS family protein [Pseudomonadota bacterium]